MSTSFVALKCPSCGANVDVYEDTEHFACGYCGAQIEVRRRGGTVSLKALTEAILRVQRGTDRTADELTLVRLRKELPLLVGQKAEVDKKTEGRKLGGFLFLIIGGLLFLGGWIALAFVFLVPGSLILTALKPTKMSILLGKQISDLRRRITEIEERLA